MPNQPTVGKLPVDALPRRGRLPRLPPLTGTGREIEQTIAALVELLKSSRARGAVALRIISPAGERAWTLHLADVNASMAEGYAPNPDLEVITTEATWLQIADAELSPVEAFGQGKMRIRGNARMGVQILKVLCPQDVELIDRLLG